MSIVATTPSIGRSYGFGRSPGVEGQRAEQRAPPAGWFGTQDVARRPDVDVDVARRDPADAHGLSPARIRPHRLVHVDELGREDRGLRALLARERDQLLGPEVDDRLEQPVGRAVVDVRERLTPEGSARRPRVDTRSSAAP